MVDAAARRLPIEPVTGHDPQDDESAQISNLLLQFQREPGVSHLFITHNIGIVEYIADEVVVMNKGRVEESGPASAVLRDPRSDYTRTLLAAVPRVAVAAAA